MKNVHKKTGISTSRQGVFFLSDGEGGEKLA
jgi:hypothetical protein